VIDVTKEKIGTICLWISTFLNPCGFDILVYKLTELTKNYWSSMHVLYLFALLFFGLSYIFYKFKFNKIGNILMTIALFLNPFGYDLIIYGLTLITHDYWVTIKIMYILTFLFFIMFLYLSNLKNIEYLKEKKWIKK
jgi:hypothetical protein